MTVSLTELVHHPEKLNSETLYELRLLVSRYPYSQVLRILLLKNLYLLKDNSFGAELRKAALYVTDRSQLFQLIESERYKVRASKKSSEEEVVVEEDPSLDRTLTLIDSFLSTLSEEEMQISQSLDYAVDYTSYLLEQDDITTADGETASSTESFELIDNYIARSETDTPVLSVVDKEGEIGIEHAPADSLSPQLVITEDDEEEFFTETLAKIYIKQHRYNKALEIIKKLSLKYPKKNAYFAEQITHLEELIINSKSK